MEKEREPQAGSERTGTGEVRLEPLVLASGSPRRSQLLQAVGWPFEAQAADVDESLIEGEPAVAYVERLARTKAESVAAQRLFGKVLGADTTVVIDGSILAKPEDEEDARRMLRLLSGRWHEVLTGVAIVRAESKRYVVGHELTRVRFAPMTEAEIDWYVATGEPMDKAGAYGAQGPATLFIRGIEGDYWNVVGLPLQLVYRLSQQI